MLLFRSIGGAFGAALVAAAWRASGFATGFLVCAAVAGLAFLVASLMRDTDLRS